MKSPSEHVTFLQRRPFQFGCTTTIFPEVEYQALVDYGNWMDALATGLIQPTTPAQEHFLKVDREEAEAETVYERAWVRLKGRRAFEQEEGPPSPPLKDYGIVEWDADRWW